MSDEARLLTEDDIEIIFNMCAAKLEDGVKLLIKELKEDPRIESMPGEYGRGLRNGLQMVYDIFDEKGLVERMPTTEEPNDDTA